ncbi:MAG: 3'-5' exonuclease [Cyanobacteria bacterium J06639_18]
MLKTLKSKTLKLKTLEQFDSRQERNARRIGDGHRVIYGIAGSGKTVLLIARARLLSEQKPNIQILMLCYNVTLATYLRKNLRDCPNVTVRHFDGWSKTNRCGREKNESSEDLGARFLDKLRNGCHDTRRYDAVLIDEAQDFDVSWFKCVLEAMKDRENGDLVIVADGSQGLYKSRKISWKQIGIKAQGRTIYERFDLHKNYRNRPQIVELAAIFARNSKAEQQTDDSIRALFVDPSKCQRSNGMKPVLVESYNRETECNKVMNIARNLLQGDWFGKSILPLKPEEIAILYPMIPRTERANLKSLIQGLNQFTKVVWLNESPTSRELVTEPGIKIQTIHSAKGLQYRAVILMWADLLPRTFPDTNEAEERCVMYVGMTRPEDYLVISSSGFSPFIQEIKGSGKAHLI